jgi:hypothetical protein
MRYLSLIVFLFVIVEHGLSQNYGVYRQKRLYLGLSGGLNFSGTHVTDDYSVLHPTAQSSDENGKKNYEGMGKNLGSQFGIYFSYSFTNKLSIGTNPTFQLSSFNYRNAYAWTDTVNASDFAIEMMHQQKLSNINVPIFVRYDFTARQFSPFIQGGILMSFRNQARKMIYYDNLIDEKVDKKLADHTEEADLTQHINKFNFGLTAGMGITFFANYFAITLESNFRYGFNKVINDANRYADYTGFSVQYLDALDQLKMMNIDVQLSIMFPLDNSISLGILRKRRH